MIEPVRILHSKECSPKIALRWISKYGCNDCCLEALDRHSHSSPCPVGFLHYFGGSPGYLGPQEHHLHRQILGNSISVHCTLLLQSIARQEIAPGKAVLMVHRRRRPLHTQGELPSTPSHNNYVRRPQSLHETTLSELLIQ